MSGIKMVIELTVQYNSSIICNACNKRGHKTLSFTIHPLVNNPILLLYIHKVQWNNIRGSMRLLNNPTFNKGFSQDFCISRMEITIVGGWNKSHYLACFGHISIKIMLKINREQNKQKKNNEKKRAFWALKIIGLRPLWGATPWIC